MAVQQRETPQLYKDTLTPVLHRRFTKAASITLLACYVVAVLIGEKSSLFWSWFPLGKAGIRTLLLFISALAIFVLRVAQLHVGLRTTLYPLQTFTKGLLQFATIRTLGWYFFSAWWFSEVYVWSVPRDANLTWIAQAKPYERPHLNERPIYLRSIFYLLALMQTCIHLFYDYDRVFLPYEETHSETLANGRPRHLVSPMELLKVKLPQQAQASFLRCLSMTVLGPLIYSAFLRRIAWRWTLSFAEKIWTLPRSSSIPPSIPPYHISLIFRSVISGYMLVMLWEISSLAFGLYTVQEPLKRGRPLTDFSRDPNGTLLIGLNSKRELPRTFAFWELFYISQQFPIRRKAFYEDIDRKGASTWTQLLSSCLGVIQPVNSRVIDTISPSASLNSTSAQQRQQVTVQALPRMSTPLKEDQIFAHTPSPSTRREKVQQTVGTFAKSQGQNPPETRKGWTPIDLLTWIYHFCLDKLVSPEQKQELSKINLGAKIDEYALNFLRSPFGIPFRQTLRRRSAAVVLGSPTGNLGNVLDAIDSITQIAICSLTEDPYGKVQTDVPTIIKTFTSTIQNLNALKTTLQPHWTDVEAKIRQGQHGENDFEEVDLLLRALKVGLARLLDAFGEYADALGLSSKEMRIFREAAGVDSTRREVEQVENGRRRRG